MFKVFGKRFGTNTGTGRNGATIAEVTDFRKIGFFTFQYKVVENGLFCSSVQIEFKNDDLINEGLKAMEKMCRKENKTSVLLEVEGNTITGELLRENGFTIDKEQAGAITASKKI